MNWRRVLGKTIVVGFHLLTSWAATWAAFLALDGLRGVGDAHMRAVLVLVVICSVWVAGRTLLAAGFRAMHE